MRYKDIEFVCSANIGRSPLAKAFGKKYLEQRGIVEEVKLTSSGTLVDSLKSFNQEIIRQMLKGYICKALQQGVIDEEEAEKIRTGDNFEAGLLKFVMAIKKRMPEQRRIILEEANLGEEYNPEREPRQTRVRAEAELILPLDKENYLRVLDIYSNTEIKPRIELIGEIENIILSSDEECRKIVNEVREVTERALDKYLF